MIPVSSLNHSFPSYFTFTHTTHTHPYRFRSSLIYPILLVSADGDGADRVPCSAVDSGVNENVTSRFPGSTVQVGGTKRGDNPTIPDEEGGELNKASGRYVTIERLAPLLNASLFHPSPCRHKSWTPSLCCNTSVSLLSQN